MQVLVQVIMLIAGTNEILADLLVVRVRVIKVRLNTIKVFLDCEDLVSKCIIGVMQRGIISGEAAQDVTVALGLCGGERGIHQDDALHVVLSPQHAFITVMGMAYQA
jgi:hypothetical protein